ncbi:hypothetical protein ABIF61_007230 [Bradyrhizobium japonicum]|uniref:hypothetical protein n=1 Tax=Bradyrhizobium TaxID=374 RepID=UPI00138AF941|nr:hypothetical protein [Bradyrhizobium sp. CCBAU 15544]
MPHFLASRTTSLLVGHAEVIAIARTELPRRKSDSSEAEVGPFQIAEVDCSIAKTHQS